MPNNKNLEQVTELTDKLGQSAGVVFVDYKGLANLQLESLRNTIEAKGGSLNISKNTLMKIAINKTNFNAGSSLSDETLAGPTASIFLSDDPISPIKALVEFIKENELPVIKGGILDKKFMNESDIDNLSKLPSYEELIAKTIGQIQAPLYGLVNVLSGNMRQLVTVLSEIQKNPKETVLENSEGGDSGGE